VKNKYSEIRCPETLWRNKWRLANIIQIECKWFSPF